MVCSLILFFHVMNSILLLVLLSQMSSHSPLKPRKRAYHFMLFFRLAVLLYISLVYYTLPGLLYIRQFMVEYPLLNPPYYCSWFLSYVYIKFVYIFDNKLIGR